MKKSRTWCGVVRAGITSAASSQLQTSETAIVKLRRVVAIAAGTSVAENASRKRFGSVEMSFRDVDATEESDVLTGWEAVTWRRVLARTYGSSFTFPTHPPFRFGH
jgi:hypothetical protein